jgi:hypothetical protein
MSQTAKFVKEITVIDPDTKGEVHMAVYKHEKGGMFAIDSSFVEQVLEDRGEFGETADLSIYDPFADMGDPTELYLEDE